MRLFPSLSEDSSLFRVLMVIFVPSLVGSAVATRAYALPPQLDVDAASELVKGIPLRPAPPSPWMRIDVAVPALKVDSAKNPDKVANKRNRGAVEPTAKAPGEVRESGFLLALATAADSVISDLSPSTDDALDAALRNAGARDQASLEVSHVNHVATSRDKADLFVEVTDFDDVPPGEEGIVERATDDVGPARRLWQVEPEQTPVVEGDLGTVRGAVAGVRGRIESCGEQATKLDPDIGGRLSLSWTVNDGKVASVLVADNQTGSDELGDCVVRAVRRARFDANFDAEVAEYTWVFAAR